MNWLANSKCLEHNYLVEPFIFVWPTFVWRPVHTKVPGHPTSSFDLDVVARNHCCISEGITEFSGAFKGSILLLKHGVAASTW